MTKSVGIGGTNCQKDSFITPIATMKLSWYCIPFQVLGPIIARGHNPKFQTLARCIFEHVFLTLDSILECAVHVC